MKKNICFVTAVAATAESFLHDHISALRNEYCVYYVCNEPDEKKIKLKLDGYHYVNIQRKISIWNDLRAVWQMYSYLKKMKFDAVHTVTPKAGLVTAIAARLAGIPHRTHIFTGQAWATRTGVMKCLLKLTDKMIVWLDNYIMVDGKSQRSYIEKEGVLKKGQGIVFLHGSISGVNSERFVPNRTTRNEIREKIGIKDEMLCFIFLGRLNHDKGIGELYEAYNRLATERKDVFLLLVGIDEEGYITRSLEYKSIKEGENFHFYGLTPEPEKVLNAGDVYVLPTYREGFGTSVLEAACIGLPSICSDAYGVQDAFIDGETGLRCKVGDAESLYQCMRKMCENPDMVKEMGRKSRERALRDFDGAKLTECWVDFYREILKD